MNSIIKNIGLGLVTVIMMSACGAEDVVDAVADVTGNKADISSATYTASQATAYLGDNYIAIVKYVDSDALDEAAIVAKTEYDVDNIIRVEESYSCSSLGLSFDSSEEYDGGTLSVWTTGGKTCYEFDYSVPGGSSNQGNAHAAYSTNNVLDF